MILKKWANNRNIKSLKRTKGLVSHLPKHLWKNDYPIVLIHGFGCSVPD
jgi:hypothetical protein